MNKRIKYSEKSPGIFESIRRYTTADGVKLKIVLNTEKKSFSLVHDLDGKVLNEVTESSMHEVKKAVKAQLKKLGVQFEKENRDRKSKEQPEMLL